MKFKPKARVSALVVQNSDSELLIYDLETNTALSLNETSARIWRSSNGKREAADICSYLEESEGVHVNEDLVLLAIRQLSDSNLLAANMPESDKPGRVSRRKLLRQIGAGSAVVLPVIHSIVAPKASAAATGLTSVTSVLPGLGESCDSSVRQVIPSVFIPANLGNCQSDTAGPRRTFLAKMC